MSNLFYQAIELDSERQREIKNKILTFYSNLHRVLISDGSSENVAHAWIKLGFRFA